MTATDKLMIGVDTGSKDGDCMVISELRISDNGSAAYHILVEGKDYTVGKDGYVRRIQRINI